MVESTEEQIRCAVCGHPPHQARCPLSVFVDPPRAAVQCPCTYEPPAPPVDEARCQYVYPTGIKCLYLAREHGDWPGISRHPFVPAPTSPAPESAEARERVIHDITTYERAGEAWADLNAALDDLEAVIRAPLEERIRELERERKHYKILRYSPTGDNHHNAADCPYCSERREEQLRENRELFVRAEIAEAQLRTERIANDSANQRIRELTSALADSEMTLERSTAQFDAHYRDWKGRAETAEAALRLIARPMYGTDKHQANIRRLIAEHAISTAPSAAVPAIDVEAYLAQHEDWMVEGCVEHGPMGHHIDYYDDKNNRRCNCGRNLGTTPSAEEASE